jgi:hypothetical protein
MIIGSIPDSISELKWRFAAMKIISLMNYSKNMMMMMALSSLSACSGGAGDQISLKSDLLWEKLMQMQEETLKQNAPPAREGHVRHVYSIEQINEPAIKHSEEAEETFIKDRKKDLIFKKLDHMMKAFSKAVLKFEKMPAGDREFEMLQIERLFSRFISEKMKWDELEVKAEDAVMFTEKFNQAQRLYRRLSSVK